MFLPCNLAKWRGGGREKNQDKQFSVLWTEVSERVKGLTHHWHFPMAGHSLAGLSPVTIFFGQLFCLCDDLPLPESWPSGQVNLKSLPFQGSPWTKTKGSYHKSIESIGKRREWLPLRVHQNLALPSLMEGSSGSSHLRSSCLQSAPSSGAESPKLYSLPWFMNTWATLLPFKLLLQFVNALQGVTSRNLQGNEQGAPRYLVMNCSWLNQSILPLFFNVTVMRQVCLSPIWLL